MFNQDQVQQNGPLIIELVGLAGAGKSTLSRALIQRYQKSQVAEDLKLRNWRHASIFLGQLPTLMSFALQLPLPNRQFTWNEIKAMVYLKAWPRFLKLQSRPCGTILFLDHGPIFKMATLDAFGPEALKTESFTRWWHATLEQWALTLDAVIWIEAPHKVLIDRINTREQQHAVKGKPDVEAVGFLTQYQKSYKRVLAQLASHGGPRALHFDSSTASVEQITDAILFAVRYRFGIR